MIEKLAKEFEKIRASLTRSKKLIVADIDKIDEKYRKLAQEEKKNLTENLAVLNEQLKYYDKMLKGEPTVEETDEEPANEEQEAVIQDTIFPENNEPEEEEKKEEKEEEKPVDLDAEEDAEWEQRIQSGEIKEVESGDDVSVDNQEPAENAEPEKKGLTKEEIVEKLENAGFVNIDEVANQEEAPAQIDVDENDWPIPEDWK